MYVWICDHKMTNTSVSSPVATIGHNAACVAGPQLSLKGAMLPIQRLQCWMAAAHYGSYCMCHNMKFSLGTKSCIKAESESQYVQIWSPRKD